MNTSGFHIEKCSYLGVGGGAGGGAGRVGDDPDRWQQSLVLQAPGRRRGAVEEGYRGLLYKSSSQIGSQQ